VRKRKTEGEPAPRLDAPTLRLGKPPVPEPAKKTKKASKRIPKTPSGAKTTTFRKHLLVRVGAPPIEIDLEKPFTFGRAETCSLPIPSARVSRVHAEIRAREDGKLVLHDLGSANGTFVGGKPIKEHVLAAGDEIEVGPFLCVYRRGDPDELSKPVPTPLSQKTMIDGGELLGGQIGASGLAEVLQGLDFHKKTGTLFVFSSAGQGWLTLVEGAPRAAAAGKLEDAEAVFFLLGLTEGRFSFTSELRSQDHRLKTTVTGLLLEFGRRADEDAAKRATKRR
jgi:pSer/pThr/pTyr-binding forkhead associated (FHA) protein